MFVLIFALGCGQKTSQPSGITVVVTDPTNPDIKITLSQKQAQWFVKDISGPGRRSRISEFPAAPLAAFEYGGRKYLMHGNAVIHVEKDGTEYLWTGPYLQALILADSHIPSAIETVERMADLSGVTLDAPGAYPGGGPAPLVPEPAAKDQ
jgi:hypothetical protein